MRTTTTALIVISVIASLMGSVARAAPTEVNVRIEGESETLFEGPIWAEGHNVQASSDTQERSCDGINPLDPQNKTPGPTPTAASVDAMSLIGETFDGRWYPGYNDYFITRWGPDREAEGMSWGILVNNVFTDVGGCQYELDTGDEVLWAFNAFAHEPFLALFPAGSTSGARPLTATAELGRPFEVQVLDYGDDAEHAPPAHPERSGASPYEGADVSPVHTDAKGFERVDTEDPTTATTGTRGEASITFSEPGWHRIKATSLDAGGYEDVIRSNRLDVCVLAPGASDCGAPPAEDLVRTPMHTEEEVRREAAQQREAEVKLHEEEVKRQEAAAAERREEETRAGLEGEGQPPAPAATSPLPESHPLDLDSPPAGPVSVNGPLERFDDRWSGLRYQGRWQRLRQPGAWLGTISRGRRGAQVSVRLEAGRPVFLVRGTPRAARVEVRVGSRRERFTLARAATGSSHRIVAAKRSHAGTVRLRVLSGEVDLDDVSVES